MTSPCSPATGRSGPARSCCPATRQRRRSPAPARHQDHRHQRAGQADADRGRRRHLGHRHGGRLGAPGRDRPRCARPGRPASAQMLYRFRNAGTAAAIRADVAAVSRGAAAGRGDRAPVLPDRPGSRRRRGSRRSCRSWSRSASSAWCMSVLIVANVVSGAVVAGLPPDRHPEEHRLHPRAGRGGLHRPRSWCPPWPAAWPALVVGEPAGRAAAAARPRTCTGWASSACPVWVDVAVPVRACSAWSAIAALLPAMRAGPAQRGAGHRRRPRPAAGPRLRRAPAARAGCGCPGR